jgi:hypothetical protein
LLGVQGTGYGSVVLCRRHRLRSFSKHVSGQGDEGESVGLAVLQTIDSYGIDLYGQFRWYSLDRAVGPSFDDISVFTAGARWAF